MTRPLTIIAMAGGADGSGYYRLYLPFKHLAANSRHLALIPPPGRTPPQPSRADMEDVDVFIAQRPIGAVGMRTWDNLAGTVARVYEVDDDLLTVDPSGLPHLCDERIRESIRGLLTASEMVTVSTPYLAELYAPLNSNIRVLPNFVKAGLLDMPRIRRDRVTIGYQGGASHLVDMCAVQDELRDVLDANPDTDMHWIGVDNSPLTWVRRPWLRERCRFTRWSEDVGDSYRAVDFDIAIAPLAGGDLVPFNRAKSSIKALEAAARGIPVIAQDMEPYSDFVKDGETGYLVRTGEEWVKRLTDLIHDEAAREELGRNAREQAKACTIEGNWQLFEKAYEEASR